MQLYMSWYIISFFGFAFLNILIFSSTLVLTSSYRRNLYTFYGLLWHNEKLSLQSCFCQSYLFYKMSKLRELKNNIDKSVHCDQLYCVIAENIFRNRCQPRWWLKNRDHIIHEKSSCYIKVTVHTMARNEKISKCYWQIVICHSLDINFIHDDIHSWSHIENLIGSHWNHNHTKWKFVIRDGFCN